MELYLIYPIVFIVYFLLSKNIKEHRISTSIIFLYFFASLVGCLIGMRVLDISANRDPSFFAIIYHIVLLLLLLEPFKKFDSFKGKKMIPIDEGLLNVLTFFVVLFVFIGIIGDLQKFNFGSLVEDVSDLRQSLEYAAENVSFTDHFSYFCKHYGCVALALAFYYMKYYSNRKIIIILLLICSLSSVIAGLQFAAREYLIKYIFVFIIAFYFMKDSISNKWGKSIKKYGFILGGLFAAFFLLISVLRFGSGTGHGLSSDVYMALLSYFGQGFANFSAIFNEFPDGVAGGGMHFSFFVGHGFSAINLNQSINSNLSLNTFSTTIGSWVFDAGRIATVFITIVYVLMMRLVARQKFTVFTFVYMLWFYEFIFSCLFFHNQVFSLSRLLSFVVIIVFDIINRSTVTTKRS